MFDADRPIQNSSQDKLNRVTFAKYLARCFLDRTDPESFVAGLNGGWGSGKTSIINLVVEELQLATPNLEDHAKPIILNFSPWSYSGQNQLIYNFFRRLSATLRNAPYLENRERILYLLELYVSFFTLKEVPKSLQPKLSWWKRSRKQNQIAWESGLDLTQVKTELNSLLMQQQHKIIIIIDNISRLLDIEIKQIFQIVKSMGDYANTVYLLAFDKEQIVRGLNNIRADSGEDFIDKIIQLPFDIPPILQQDLEKIFADRLKGLIENLPEDDWNAEYWADIYYNALKYYFKNCRDITRYVNTLNFSYLRVKELVNSVDFFAITALAVFSPDIYYGIRDNKDLFTDLLDHVYEMDEEDRQKEQARCDEIIKRDHYMSEKITLSLLMNLFPRLRKIYLPEEAFYYSDSIARKLKRISSPDVFDIYFRLSLQANEMSHKEFDTIMSMSNQFENFDHVLARLNQDDRILAFLDLMDSNKVENLPLENCQIIISSLLDNGDLFPPGIIGHLSLDTPMRISRIIHRILKNISAPEDKFIILQKAIAEATKSIDISVRFLLEQSKQHDEALGSFLPVEFRDLTPEQLESLQKLTASCIENWAHSGRLIDHPHLISLLYAWRNWGESENCFNFVKTATNTDKGLVQFLTAALKQSIDQAMQENEKKLHWEQDLQHIADFIAPTELEKRAVNIFEDLYFEKLREREQLSIMIFLELINAKTKKIIPNTVD